MSAQEKTEDVLRRIHLLFSKALPYQNSKRAVIIDKNDMMDLLKELTSCMYDMQEEYELTEASRDKADRRQQKKNEERLFDAKRNADDVYAASVMYSDRALSEVEDRIDEAVKKYEALHRDFMATLAEKKQEVKSNRLELAATLQDLIDTQKYTHLIEDENARRAKEKAAGMEEGLAADAAKTYEDVKPEIVVNAAYFEQTGQALPEGVTTETEKEEEEQAADLSADLDSEYFKWKDGEEDPAASEKGKKKGFSLFGKK